MTIFMDNQEPVEIEALMAQSAQVIKPQPGLNSQGFADYLWFACDGHRIQVERKQIYEVLGGMDNVEEQLRRELSNEVEETILLIEGICEPVMGLKMATQTWHKAKEKNIMVPGRIYNTSYSGYQAWKNQLDKAGITVVETFDYIATAITLVAIYQNAQKLEHKTLKRYIKDKIHIETYNPHVLTLMGISGGGIGEEIGKALIDRYGTAHYTLMQDVEGLAETLIGEKRFGINRARKLLRSFGRNI